MIHLKDTRHGSTADFLEEALGVAHFYGFVPFEEVAILRRRVRAEGSQRPAVLPPQREISYARRDERALASSARSCVIGGGPAIFVWRIAKGSEGAVQLELHITGLESAIAEAILITVADAIAKNAGFVRRSISINSIGTPDSSNRFLRDIGLYLRKHIESISPALRPRAAEDPLGTLIQLIERGHPATHRAPSSTEYLTEEERRRFWDLLEYLEVAGIPYDLDPRVLGSRDCWAHTLFEIAWVDPETNARITFARGGRYDPLATRFAGVRSFGAAVTILCETRGRAHVKRLPVRETSPVFYFAHLGPEARRRTLPVLELLRQSDIHVHQSLNFERIGEQMAVAERLNTPYILIMGHKEAVEGTVLVREVATNSQRAVPLDELPGFLKRQRARV